MILIIAAMPEEYNALASMMDAKVEDEFHHIKYATGLIDAKEVILMLSGVGKVNAAYSLATILCKFKVSFIINIGSAGGVVNDHHVKPLDIVVAKQVVQHDVDLKLAGRDAGVLPDLPQYYPAYQSEEIIAKLNECPIKTHYATIATGDQFVCDLHRIAEIVEDFSDVCAVEMEAGAIAQIAYINNIPFMVIRSISDVIGLEKDNQTQFDEYIKQASNNSALLTKEILSVL